MTRAAIAIGSNSTRLLAVNAQGRELRARAETKLMLGLNPDGNLSDESMARTAQAVLELKMRARAFGAATIALYATSATRDAKNAAAFSNILERVSGLALTILSGEKEAQMAFLAASRGQWCAVLDIGGGSTELTYGRGNALLCAASAQAGASRLMKERTVSSATDAEAVYLRAREELAGTFAGMLSMARPPLLVGIGGTCTTAAAIFKGVDSHGEELEGTRLTLETIKKQLEMIVPMTPEQRGLIPGLYPSRALIMPHGLCILIAAMELMRFDALTVSVRNNLDALILESDG